MRPMPTPIAARQRRKSCLHLKDQQLDYFVTGFGTGGTLKGTSRVLKKKSPKTKIIVCEPDNAQLLGSGIPQNRDTDGSPSESHPNFRPHLVQGWSPDFIPKLTEDAIAAGTVDKIIPVDGKKALQNTRDLAQKEGIFCGVSGGATFTAALELAKTAPSGSNILCMLPDTGERYLSTPLFDNIAVEMSEEEWDVSRSTPNYRFDAATTGKTPEKADDDDTPPSLDDKALEFVSQASSDRENPSFYSPSSGVNSAGPFANCLPSWMFPTGPLTSTL